MVITIRSKANGASATKTTTGVKQAILFAGVVFISCLAAGCNSPGRFQPQANSARSLKDAGKREILATMVGLRYGETPALSPVSPIGAAYAFDPAGGATLPQFSDSPRDNPAFTLPPGGEMATGAVYNRPLAPEAVLPLADTGVPIDLLLRIATQSIGNLQNGTRVAKPGRPVTAGFSDLVLALRRLQLAGDLSVRWRKTDGGRQLWLYLGSGGSCESDEAAEDVAQVESLLGLSGRMRAYPIVSGPRAPGGDRIAVAIRSPLDILSNLGADIRLPGEGAGRARREPGQIRATIVVHAGKRAPADADISIPYRAEEFWIEQNDLDSKYALSLVQNLIEAAASRTDGGSPIAAKTPAY